MKKRSLLQVNSNYLKHYNNFRKLYFRIRILIKEGLFFHLSLFERNRIFKRLKLFYKRLLRFQTDLGIKFVGTTLAFTLICSATNSQGKFIERTDEENPLGGKINPFSHLDMGEKIAPAFVDIDNDTDLDVFIGERLGTVKYYEHNFPPSVTNEMPDQNVLVNQPFGFTVPGNTFYDHDAGDILTYSSTLSDGNPLPGWLIFDPDTREYSGTATITGTLNIKVIVMDIASHTAFEIFDLVVTEEPSKTDIKVSEQLNIYPVPASNLLNIKLGDIETGHVDIEILDISGRILLIERFNNISKDYIIGINISNLSKGIYYISIKIDNNIVNKKFTIN